MNDYQPVCGDNVLLTVRATVDIHGGGLVYDIDGIPQTFWSDASFIVRVEPAPRELPTKVGSLVLAHVRHYQGPVLLRFDDVSGETGPAVNPGTTWVVANAGDWVADEDIGPGWVEIDPETLLPVEDPS